MPNFKWRGIDLLGKMRRGKLFARSAQELDALLFEREIALLSCTPVRNLFFFRSVSMHNKIYLLHQLSELLAAGVLLPEALEVVGDQAGGIVIQDMLYTISAEVKKGKSLSSVVNNKYPHIFDKLMIQMIKAGQESSDLAGALRTLTDYLQIHHKARKKLRSAAMVPLLTLLFFSFTAGIIFIFIVPRFVSIYASMKQELPALTRAMIKVSLLVRSWYTIAIMSFVILATLIFRQVKATQKGSFFLGKCIINIPLIGELIRQNILAHFFQVVSILIKSGMRLVPALEVAQESITNPYILANVQLLIDEVKSGSSLSEAMKHNPEQLFGADIISLAKVAEESGSLPTMLHKGAHLYYQNVGNSIDFITTLLQPLLMIVLGLLITLLIFAVYVPILNLSHTL